MSTRTCRSDKEMEDTPPEDGSESVGGSDDEDPGQDDDAMLVGDMELNDADAATTGDQDMAEMAVARILVDMQVMQEATASSAHQSRMKY